MKTLRTLFAALLAAGFVSIVAAADSAKPAPAPTPNGLWTWTANGPMGPIEVQARLETKDGVLTGAIIAHGAEKAIEPGTFKDGKVDFIVIREVPDGKVEVKYSGKVEGNPLTGPVDRPLPERNRQVVEWQATRAK